MPLIDVETLGRAKGLQADTLRAFGVHDRPDGGVRIEYRAPDGGPARARLRLALGGLDGSRWEDGDAPVGAYWRTLVGALVEERGVLLLCEGESSCWTAWHAGFGAVGIPGADQVAALRLEHVAFAPAVAVVLEPDDPQTYPRGRGHYLAQVTERLRAVGYAGRVTILDLDNVAADLNALYQADAAAFADRIGALLERATREDELARVIAQSRRLVGCAAPDVPAGVDVANWLNISRFVEATGDENPLYTDVRYGARSIHSTMLAPPAFVLAVRMPDSAGALDAAPHGLVEMVTSLQILWDDTMRLGDRLTGRVWITDATTSAAPLSGRVTSAVTYDRNGIAFARGQCEVSLYPSSSDDKPFSQRPIHRYEVAELEDLTERLQAEPGPRGDEPRFWSKTDVGEELPALLKGPLTFSDLVVWRVAEARPLPAGNLHHGNLAGLPGRRAVNPLTGWPAWDRREAWDDSAASETAGLPAPAAGGGLLFALAGQFAGSWMGDDAFLRRLSVRCWRPLFYGDALTLRGVIVDRFVATDEASHRYHAVTIDLTGRNQLQQLVLGGEAVVFLPDLGKPLTLPICGNLSRDLPGRA